MKRLLLIVLIVTFVYWCFGESGNVNTYSVSLINADKGSAFYFIVDPKGLYGSNPYAPWFYGKVLSFFRTQLEYQKFNTPFRIMKPGESVTLNNLERGLHLVVGFFYSPTSSAYPIKVIAIKAWNGRGSKNEYVVEREPVVIVADRGILMGKWFSVPPLVSFSSGFKPLFYFRGKLSGSMVDNIRKETIINARYWSHGGTALRIVKAYVNYSKKRVRFSISARNDFKENTSIFLYIYQGSNSKINDYTVEIKPLFRGKNGGVVLWKREKNTPLYIGDVNVSGNYLEGNVDFSRLPWDMEDIEDNVYFEISTCYFDVPGNLYEEFPLAVINAKDVKIIN